MAAEDYFLVGQASVRSQKIDLAIKVWQKAVRARPEPPRIARGARAGLFPAGPAVRRGERGQVSARPAWPRGAGRVDAQARFAPSDPTRPAPPAPSSAPWTAPNNGSSWSTRSVVRKQLARSLAPDGTGRPRARGSCSSLTGSARDPETCWLLSRCDLQEAIPSEPAVLARVAGVSRVAPAGARARALRRRSPMRPLPRGDLPRPAPQPPRPHFLSQGKAPGDPLSSNGRSPIPRMPGSLTRSTNARTASKCETRSDGHVYQTIVDYAFGSGDRGLTLVGHDPERPVSRIPALVLS